MEKLTLTFKDKTFTHKEEWDWNGKETYETSGPEKPITNVCHKFSSTPFKT